MKQLLKFSAIFALALSLASCSDNDVPEMAQKQENILPQSEIRSVDEAYDIAAKSLIWLDGENSRAEIRYLPAKNEIKVVKNKESRGESSDTLMYVVNFEDEQGFAIVPANRNMPELLAVTESGSYDPSVPSEVEPFNEYMDNAISTLSKKDLNIDTLRVPLTEQKIKTKETKIEVKPRANYSWGQTGVEGMFCPNHICGCAPLAVALCMSYYGHPMTFDYFDHGVHAYTYLDWLEIVKHNARHDYKNGSGFVACYEDVDTTAQQNLGRLCREIGILANSKYESNFTSTTSNGILKALKSFGYKTEGPKNFSDGNESIISSDGILIVFANDGTNGHAWVLDGYIKITIEDWVYQRVNDPNVISPKLEPDDEDWILVDHYISQSKYVHFNWGWSGKCNGYFIADIWNPNSASWYDDSTNTGKFSNYYKNKQYIYVYR